MGNDMTTTEEQVYNAFSAAVNSGDLVGAFEHATEDMKFRVVGSHPEICREFQGMNDILQNCWMRVFEHFDEKGVRTKVNRIVAGDGVAFVHFSSQATGRSGMAYHNEYVHMLQFEGDKISSITEFLNTDLLNQLLDQ